MGSLRRSSLLCSFIQGLAVWSVVLADERWTVTIPARMSAPIGSCMVIPCSFTLPPSDRSVNVIWHLYAKFTYPLVYSKSNPSDVIDGFRGRTELIGSASEGNCSLKINQMQASQNAQKIYVWIEPNKLTSRFYDKTVTLEVTARAPQPEIQVHRTEDLSAGRSGAQASIELTEGDEVTAICDVIHTCPPSPPSVSFRLLPRPQAGAQWSHQEEGSGRWRVSVQMSWTASSRDHGRSVACDVTHPGGQTASRELVLKVTYPPKSVNVHGDRNVVPPGGSVSLSCKSQANPPADSFQWYRVLHGRPTLLDHTSQTVTITELDRDQNLFHCTANNSMGSGGSSVFEVIKEYKPSISADSLCSISGGFLSCGCEATARPVASLQWRVEGRGGLAIWNDRVAGPSASSDESYQPQPISEFGSREEEEEDNDDDNDISGPQQPTEPSDDNTSSTNQGLEAEPVRQKTIGIR
ncbi:hypothetical protein SKAU_G00333130 [Synaphobranchus kaupii]|uniref:Ig-like domain-containing protein n=1 Tax=Synaphobranchus kaupii TaxID=118154 RepID=A0A9Q1ELJ3_SYNKA|nr:hypothetical protein SKAU_G00333130 [Synaphobranchus kaupii]